MATSSSGRVFAHLKQRSRSSFVGQHRLDVVVHSRLEHGPKYISLSTLKTTFGVAGLVLTEEEVDYLIKRFADNRRHIEWRRLMLALDVAAPADFTDPDLSFLDNLPQPYRLIVSVLDTEIVDRAWALIVDRHPELDTSTTDEARAAADIDLKRSCPPSVRLQNPHPPLLLDRCPRGAETTEAADGDATDQVEAERALKKRPNGNGDDDRTARAGARGNDGGMTLLRWDRCGELLFTAGRDGSVCLRAAGALEDIAVQISSIHTRPTSSDGNEEMMEAGAPWEVTFLSETVGTLTDQRGRPSSVRIAAVTTSANQEEINSDGAQDAATVAGGGGDTAAASGEALPSVVTVVSVLEVAVSETSSSPGAGFGGAAGTGHLNDSHDDFSSNGPTLRAICDVELTSSEAAVACALSPDGRRLAVCLTDGRIVTWVLPVFSPVLRGSQQHNPGAGEQTATQHGDDGDEGASLGDSSASLAGKDDAASMTKEAAAAAAAEAAAVEQPLRLTRPEFSIAHLPSPEELAYAKTLQEYRRRVEAGELLEPTTGSGGAGGFQEGCTPPPQAPQLSGCAHHLARVEFLPVPAGLNGGSGGGGGLSVWRANSNVWRLYRLPAPPSEGESKPESSEGKVTDAAAGGEDSNETRRGIGPIVPPKFDISSLPSAEWVLPSPITTLAVSEGDEGGGRGGGIEDDERRVHQAGGGPGCDWSCCGSTASTGELAPMVAIGTESGGVYLCDAALGTTREALSRHRARVTTLAFHRKRFVVSGSADEMLQIHHIAAPASVVGGGSCCAGGTPRLRCLHDARGSGIVGITCLRAAPLAFAEDTSGRIVVYDLLTGSMLGVLALGNSSTASAAVAKPGTIGDHGVAPSAETIPQKPRVVWAGGGDRLAAVIPEEKEGDASGLSPMLPARNEALGVWSGSDVMWNLSPGLRAIVGEERPRDVAALFFGLLPAQRKNAEGNLGFGAQPLLPPPSPPTAGRSRTHRSENDRPRRGTTPPPRTGTAGTTSRSHRSAAAAGGTSSRDTGLGGRGSAGSERPAAATKANLHTEHHKTNNRHHTTALTEGNVAKFLGGVAGGNRFGGVCAEGGFGAGGGGAGVAWRSEVGAAGRVKRYMQERHGDRAARQARLDNATRNLLHAL